MTGRVVIHQAAEKEIDEIARYLAQDSLSVGLRFYDAMERTSELLAGMPRIGRRRIARNPDLKELRSWSVKGFRNYIVFYVPVRNGIEVLHVIHGSRDLVAMLGLDE